MKRTAKIEKIALYARVSTKDGRRETAVENFLKGKTLSADLGEQAMAVALSNAAPLKYNATKIDMAKGLLASGLARLNAPA